jgi:hypothetical protein
MCSHQNRSVSTPYLEYQYVDRMRMRARVAPLLLLTAILCLPAKLRAEELDPGTEAVQLGHEGLSFYQEGKWDEARARFELANRAVYSPVFVLYMARCQRNLNRLREAAEQLEAMLARAPVSDAPVSWDNALRDGRAELEALRRRIPSLRVLRAGVTSATVDDAPVQTGELIQLNPGWHVVRGWSVDGRLGLRRISLGEGEQDVPVTLSFDDAVEGGAAPGKPQLTLTPLAPASGRSWSPNPWRTSAWITGGVAVASALVGTVTGLMAKSRFDSVRERCDGNHCPEELAAEADGARLLANVSTAAFGIAGVNAAFSVTFVLLPPWPMAEGQPARR